MQPSSSRSFPSEPYPAKKSKMQSQRAYRSKETDGFCELRDALFLADPFDTPFGKDATRPQLLLTAAKKLRNLADENQKLLLQLSARATTGIEVQIPEMTAHARIPWSAQGCDMENLFLTASELVPPVGGHENTTPAWSQSLYPSHGHDYPSQNKTLRPPCQGPRGMDMKSFC